ncbi:dihydroxyacetone kinase transcriptional activator DhaS [Tuanshanicoccus lijuaniae]|uniref:dihydroxyacetone kinase transcriptional activator DhaS n=1 Tax=Aerococcaceae bacterium zg-1292 TaxID=2774330 RepID=UPI001BD8842C|nr:dihydroxyacetone kinase transcriptional activator DhaS [Aerococcaceae bacterium zg-BR22]MBS4455517.1 dihydroxyacetone kinase transcriptional activator DhaS [Aerococcaceae bacterium zg-A91]MBS4457136.1 dihydroxyacetone kinase transcriptional activator DhaS [Aerococcaceae bacterium zg-BR33]
MHDNRILHRKRIAKSFKILVENDSFSSISVTKIMKHAGIRRQTFYNYFYDVYDLTEWIFSQDLSEIITDNLEYHQWNTIISNLIHYFDDNKNYYSKIFSYTQQNNFISYLKIQIHELLKKIYLENLQSIPKAYESHIIFQTNAIVFTINDWITSFRDFNSYYNEIDAAQLAKELVLYINTIIPKS